MKCLILILAISIGYARSETYSIYGPVRAVAYTMSSQWPCYIAIECSGSPRCGFYHASRSNEMCNYAERSQLISREMELIGQVDYGSNIAVVLGPKENAGKWWIVPATQIKA